MKRVFIIFLGVLAVACGSPSEEGFRKEGRRAARDLTDVLARVEGREDLQSAAPKLKKIFNRLGALLLEVRDFQKGHPAYVFSKEPVAESEALFQELARLYEIPGCREVIEGAGSEALHKLAF